MWGGGRADRRRVAAAEVAGDGEEAPEAAHPGEAGETARLTGAARRGERKRAGSESAVDALGWIDK